MVKFIARLVMEKNLAQRVTVLELGLEHLPIQLELEVAQVQ